MQLGITQGNGRAHAVAKQDIGQRVVKALKMLRDAGMHAV